MAIDIEIQGSPASIESAVDWLTGTLRKDIDRAADDVADARIAAGTHRQGPAGEVFAGEPACAHQCPDRGENRL